MSRDGRYVENAGAVFYDVQGWTVCRKRRSSFLRCPGMDGMSKTQEQFSTMSRDGQYALSINPE